MRRSTNSGSRSNCSSPRMGRDPRRRARCLHPRPGRRQPRRQLRLGIDSAGRLLEVVGAQLQSGKRSRYRAADQKGAPPDPRPPGTEGPQEAKRPERQTIPPTLRPQAVLSSRTAADVVVHRARVPCYRPRQSPRPGVCRWKPYGKGTAAFGRHSTVRGHSRSCLAWFRKYRPALASSCRNK